MLFVIKLLVHGKTGMNNCHYVNHLKESVAEWEKVDIGFRTVMDDSELCCTQPFLKVCECVWFVCCICYIMVGIHLSTV
jgi:hypothetical protein